MKKALVAIALAAALAVPGVAFAQTAGTQDMTQEQKELRISTMEMRQSMLQDRIEYLNGTITQEELQTRQQNKTQQMQQIRDQMHIANSENSGCQLGIQNRQGAGNGLGKIGLNRMGW